MFKLLIGVATRGGEGQTEKERTVQTNSKEHSQIPRLHPGQIQLQSQTVLPVPRQGKTT